MDAQHPQSAVCMAEMQRRVGAGLPSCRPAQGAGGGSWGRAGPTRDTHLPPRPRLVIHRTRGAARLQDGLPKPEAPPVPRWPWCGGGVQALSVPPRCFAGTQSSVESAVRFSTAGLWRASLARPRRGAELFTALLAASAPGESVVTTRTANGEATAAPRGLLRAGCGAAPVTPTSPQMYI